MLPVAYVSADGKLDQQQFWEAISTRRNQIGNPYNPRDWYHADDELVVFGGRTYALTRGWGIRFGEAIAGIMAAFPDKGVVCAPSDGE